MTRLAIVIIAAAADRRSGGLPRWVQFSLALGLAMLIGLGMFLLLPGMPRVWMRVGRSLPLAALGCLLLRQLARRRQKKTEVAIAAVRVRDRSVERSFAADSGPLPAVMRNLNLDSIDEPRPDRVRVIVAPGAGSGADEAAPGDETDGSLGRSDQEQRDIAS